MSIEATSRDGGSKLDQRSAPEESRRYTKGSKPPHSDFRNRRHTGHGAQSYNTPATGKNGSNLGYVDSHNETNAAKRYDYLSEMRRNREMEE